MEFIEVKEEEGGWDDIRDLFRILNVDYGTRKFKRF